jgi:hypothetical protein
LCSLGHRANLGAVATRGLVSAQITSTFPVSSARFHRNVIIFDYNTVLKTALLPVLKLPVDWPATKVRARDVKVVILDFDHNIVMEKAPPSVLKLPVKWPATKVPALSRSTLVFSVPVKLSQQEAGWLIDNSQTSHRFSPSDLVF